MIYQYLYCILILISCCIITTTTSRAEQDVIDDVMSNGKWSNIGTRAYPYKSHKFNYGQENREIYNWTYSTECKNSVKNVGQSYIWRSNSPIALNTFNRAEACRMLDRKHILIVGDSISNQFYITLLFMMWTEDDNKIPSHALNGRWPQTISVNCLKDHFFLVTYVRNYHLTAETTDQSKYRQVERAWIHLIAKKDGLLSKINRTIAIFNKGAHFDKEYYYISKLRKTFDEISQKYHHMINKKQLRVIFRDTVSGVHYYLQYFKSTPLTERLDFNLSVLEKHWGWDRFGIENNLTRNLIETEFPWVTYMNVSYSASLRLDSSHDGLHVCIPGPMDHWIMKFIEVINIWNLV